jgi:hypothetical protein
VVPDGEGAWLVLSPSPFLGCLQDALASEGEGCPPIALALHELQAMNLPFRHAIALLDHEPRGDRW